ncbi:riboflavin synthase [Anaerovibrio sp.]|uniref:riboflavin synthase n=1 Tax=Anaerovibrio sp. TaxID=1872532 RepID=UPI003F17F97B
MFTGIIEEVGRVKAIGNGVLQVAASRVLENVQLGDSIAVNGICLTVTEFGGGSFRADVMPETIRRTSLAELKIGSPVNLERALTLSSRLGGHIVSGHIDGVGRIVSMKDDGNAILMKVAADADILHYIVEKGSVALDGISLTVAAVTDRDFTVSLIPHTRQVTNLGSKGEGSRINIENDVVGKYVEKMLQPKENAQNAQNMQNNGQSEAGGITMDLLLRSGF